MTGPIDRILGAPTECKEFGHDVSVHWYPTGAKVGDACICGKLRKKSDDE